MPVYNGVKYPYTAEGLKAMKIAKSKPAVETKKPKPKQKEKKDATG